MLLTMGPGDLLTPRKDNAPKESPATTKWEQKLKDIIISIEDGHSRFRHMTWKEVFEAHQDATPLQTLKDTFNQNLPKFSLPLGEENVKWVHWLSEEGIWSRFSTLSQIANLKEDQRENVQNVVMEALRGDDVDRNSNGEVALHGITYLAWTSRV